MRGTESVDLVARAALLGAQFFAARGRANLARRLLLTRGFLRRASIAQRRELLLIAHAWRIHPMIELHAHGIEKEFAIVRVQAAELERTSFDWCMQNVEQIWRDTLHGECSCGKDTPPHELLFLPQATEPADPLWPSAVSLLTEICSLIGAAQRADALLGLLAAASEPGTPFHGVLDAVSHARCLGILAATTSRWREADGHFERALQACSDDPELEAPSQHGFAQMLLIGPDAVRRQRALQLLHQAAATYRRYGMSLELAAVAKLESALSAELSGEASRREAPGWSPSMTREGDYWSISFAGRAIWLPHAKGLSDLAWLIAHPEREFHVMDLVAESRPGDFASVPSPSSSSYALAEQGLFASSLESQREPVDRRAIAEYRRSLEDVEDELEEAERFGDVQRAGRLREQRELLRHELATSCWLRLQRPSASGPVDRARRAVTKRIRTAIRKISGLHPTLGRHLSNAIATGRFCSYSPEKPEQWTIVRD